MAWGGKREGSGRPKGRLNDATIKRREIAERELDNGITPLEVMLESMRRLWDDGKHFEAASIARDAAPYLHPKLTATELNVSGSLGLVDLLSSGKTPEVEG